jgi:hypothetical protein
METLKIEETLKTPSVYCNADQGLIEIAGRAIPEDSKKFFLPLINWVQMYSKSPSPKTTFNFKLEYFNTSSSKLILEIFKELEYIHKANKSVVINWYYEIDDEGMIEALETYKSMLDVPFEGIETTFPPSF